MSSIARPLWHDFEQLAVRQPQRFLHELEGLYAQYPNPADARQLTLLKAKALSVMHDDSAAESITLQLLEEAIEANDLFCTAQSNILLSKCYAAQDLSAREKPCLDVALTAARQAKDNDLIVEVICHYAAYYLRKRDRAQTFNYLERAQKQLSADSDPAIRLKVLIDTGTAYYGFQQHDKALPYISSALELSTRMGDINNQLMLLNNISTLYGMLGQFDKAEKVLNQGLALCEEHGIAFQKVQFLFGLGSMFMRKIEPEKALEYLLECEKAGAAINLTDPIYLSDLYSNLAGCHKHLYQNDLAWKRLQQAKEALQSVGNQSKLVELDVNIASYLISEGKLTESRKLLQDAIKYARKQKNYNILVIAQLNMYQSYEAGKNYSKAIAALLELHKVHEEYHHFLMSEQTRDYDGRLQQIISDYHEVERQYSSLKRDIRHSVTNDFLGSSPAHKRVLDSALLAAQHPNASVLITGESGTGKDVLARIIHYNSARKDAPMVAVNMASISATLMESEFFGHKKGSFTGAVSDTRGLFLEANHGTLFLDEISEMPVNLQAKLLRVLESRTLTPVGSSKELEFDTRIISSTNRDLLKMIQDNQFRLDLYHRLNTIEIHIPPLRERPEDIEVLIRHYAEKLAREIKAPIPKLERSFISRLQEYRFPGNVRELRNIIERLLIMHSGEVWTDATLAKLPSLNLLGSSAPAIDIRTRQAILEKQQIIDALQQCAGKQKDAARLLGISESTLTRRIARYKLEIYTRKGR